MRNIDRELKDAHLLLGGMRDLATPEEFRENHEPGTPYTLEELKADYLYDISMAQAAQATATVALVHAVVDLTEAILSAGYNR